MSKKIENLTNPGVEVVLVYANHIDTGGKFFFNKSPKADVLAGKGYIPDRTENFPGDGTVPSVSVILPGVKWADDFNNKREGSKPVTLVEVCSKYKRRSGLFDGLSKKTLEKNAYFGVDCGCKPSLINGSKGTGCDHSNIPGDSGILKFLENTIIYAGSGKTNGRFTKFSE